MTIAVGGIVPVPVHCFSLTFRPLHNNIDIVSMLLNILDRFSFK